jgi:hypothetical protein
MMSKYRYIENIAVLTILQIPTDITGFSGVKKLRYGWVAQGNLTLTPLQIRA